MSEKTPLARKEGQALTVEPSTFDLTSMKSMADRIKELKVFMDGNLEEGITKDWEYAHVIWKRPLKQGEDKKPCLLDPGTAKIMNFMTVRPRHRIIEKEIDPKTMQLRYVIAVEIVPFLPVMYYNPVENRMEQVFPVIAEGLGSATTREKRYKVRFEWMKERDLRAEGWTEDELKKYAEEHPDMFRAKADPKYDNLYFMPTAESLGLDNTLLKMAAKRAAMDAVFQLPGVAGRYSQEIDLKADREELAQPVAPVGLPAAPMTQPASEPKPAPAPQPEARIFPLATNNMILMLREQFGINREEIIQRMDEKRKTPTLTGGQMSDNDALLLVQEDLYKTKVLVSPPTKKEELPPIPTEEKKTIGEFMPASELPVMPPDFKLSEEAAYVADYIRENFDQPADAVRAMIYAELAKAAGLLTDVAAAKLVQSSFEERSKPAEEPKDLDAARDEVSDALNAANLDGSMIEVQDDGTLRTKMRADGKRVFLGDIWGKYNGVLDGLGYRWVRDGAKSRWEKYSEGQQK